MSAVNKMSVMRFDRFEHERRMVSHSVEALLGDLPGDYVGSVADYTDLKSFTSAMQTVRAFCSERGHFFEEVRDPVDDSVEAFFVCILRARIYDRSGS